MAKKAKFSIGKIVAAVAALLGVVAIIMLAAPGVTYTIGDKTTSYSCAQVTFGYSEKLQSLSTEVFKFSFGNFLTYLLLLVGIVFAVLALLGKLGKIAPLAAAVAFVVAAILFFCTAAMCVPGNDIVEAMKEKFALGAGAIVGGVLSILSALASASTLFLKK